jgi:hypothetical protein
MQGRNIDFYSKLCKLCGINLNVYSRVEKLFSGTLRCNIHVVALLVGSICMTAMFFPIVCSTHLYICIFCWCCLSR